MDQVGDAYDVTHLVGLEVPDEMPAHTVPDDRMLLLELLCATLADIQDVLFCSAKDDVGGECLGHRDDRRRLVSCLTRSLGHALHHLVVTSPDVLAHDSAMKPPWRPLMP